MGFCSIDFQLVKLNSVFIYICLISLRDVVIIRKDDHVIVQVMCYIDMSHSIHHSLYD
jgi:hypothetical protein